MPPPQQDENLAAVVSSAAQDIGSFIRSQRELAQVSVRQLAEKAGVSNPYLSQIERGLRKPSADVLSQIAKALRVSAEVLYIRAGILEPGETNAVRDAITTDMAINERQKQVLLDIYTSFCAQNDVALAEAASAGGASGDSAGDVDEEPTTEQQPQSPLALLEAPHSTPDPKTDKEGNNHG
jgi:transcriptional regulator with XRE-family HTH domain